MSQVQKETIETPTVMTIDKGRQESDKTDPAPLLSAPMEEKELWMARNFSYVSSFESFQGVQVPAVSALWGYDDGWYRLQMTKEIVHVTQYAGRRLTIEEYHALTQTAASKIVAQSYDRPLALALVGCLIKGGWKDLSVGPFKPGHVGLNVASFPTQTSSVLNGVFAITAWQILRCGLCGVIGYLTYRLLKPVWYRFFSVNRGIMQTPAAWISPRLHKLQSDARKHNTKAIAKKALVAKRTRRA